MLFRMFSQSCLASFAGSSSWRKSIFFLALATRRVYSLPGYVQCCTRVLDFAAYFAEDEPQTVRYPRNMQNTPLPCPYFLKIPSQNI